MSSSTFEPDLVGCRVRLSAEEGDYQGTVHAVGARDGSVTLVGVTLACGQRQETLRGVQKFFRGDVRSVEVLEAAPEAAAPPPPCDRMVMDRGSRSRPATFSHRLVDDSLLLAQVAVDDSDDSSSGVGGGEAASTRAASPPPRLRRPASFALVDAVDEVHDAARYLAEQATLGLAAEGVLLGRAGQLSLLTLADAEFVFVFDVATCGRPAVEALRPVLESASVQKVVHDCRGLSDLMAHQFNVRLANVFDTQAAEVYIYQQQSGAVPAFVSNVSHTLVTRLGLRPRQVFFPRYRIERMREDQQVWLKRPLSDTLLEGAVQNAAYLRELRHVQMESMFSTFVRCVDVYLGAVRDADDEDAAAAPFDSHRVPVGVQKILEAGTRPSPATPDSENPGLVNNVLRTLDDSMQFTRNVWRSDRP